MPISRRKLLGNLGVAAIAGAGINVLAGSARAAQSMAMSMAAPPHSSAGTIFLNRNENAYGPSEQVVLAMQRSLARANRFPRKAWKDLADQIAAFHKVQAEHVVVGCGSTEIFKSAVDAYLGPGKSLIISTPTFDVIGTYASAAGANVINVPLSRFWSNDLDAMLAKVDASTGLIYICNPNDPTAILNHRDELEAFIGKLPANVRVILDEAYHDTQAPLPPTRHLSIGRSTTSA